VEIRCPHCDHPIKIKSAKPGTHRPQCPKCRKGFQLTVPQGGGQPVVGLAAASPEATLSDASTAATIVTSPGASAPPSTAATHANVAPDATRINSAGLTVPMGAEVTDAQGAAEFSLGHLGHASQPADLPAMLGGYRILRELGRGAMGAVYLARQVSLDRNVALKVIQSRLASNPTFIARFTREAYAAAQLSHPNVVQIYDLGCEGNTYFFSMEFVEGESLGALVDRSGKLDGETAVRYILQAARGLKFAHDQGLVHRDIKPDNLLLSKHGVVKLADLGLVKAVGRDEPPDPSTPPGPLDKAGSLGQARADITEANVAMGTPAYMAPEQAENASGVDHRADIYSLGCTMYVLLTGQPPFQGTSALEVITKHKSEPITRPEAVVREVPKGLSEINMKMVAKRPDERYSDLGQAIQEMESYLGIQGKGPYLPQEENLATLEQAAKSFYEGPAARLRSKLWLGFFGACLAVFFIGLFISPLVAGAVVALGLITPLAHFVITGLRERPFLFLKVRELVAGSGWGDRASAVLGVLLLAGALWLLGQLWVWAGAGVLGALLGAAFSFSIDRKLDSQRRGALEQIEQMIKLLRLRGLDEMAIKEFVATYAGSRWEELFEALFGYEAKLAARAQWAAGDERRRRDRFAAWRDPLIRWIDGKLRARREARERKHLLAIEEKNLRAQGIEAAEARRRAERAAEVLVNGAAEIRRAADAALPAEARPAETPEQKRARIRTMLLAAGESPRSVSSKALSGLMELVFGAKVRFLLGGALVAGFFFWLQQHGLIPDRERPLLEQLTALWQARGPLELPLVPSFLTALFGGVEAGAAGFILLASALLTRLRAAAFAFPAAALALFTPLPSLPGLDAVADGRMVSLAAGAAVMVVGFLVGGRK
jgi:hypothetical protein